jgi:phosphodiesterase/alkaline phosphatase D-like protein
VSAQAGASETTIEGQVLPGAQHASCQLEYGTTEAYGLRAPCNEALIRSADSGAVASVHVTDLEPGTAYDYRLIVVNASGPSAPEEGKGMFTTHIPTPLLSAESASGVGASDASLAGRVATEGTRTRYWFEYGATEALGQSTPGDEVPGGPSEASVGPEAISGLAPDTVYYYRLRAANRWHEAFGETQTFTTASNPPAASPGSSPTIPSPGPSTTSPGGSELGVSLTPPMTQPLPPAPTVSTATPKRVAKCKRGEKRERGRCVRLKKKRARSRARR